MADPQILSRKLMRRLKEIRDASDCTAGMYYGLRYETAPKQYDRLYTLGMAVAYYPPNMAHKPRVVITDHGRRYLESFSL